MVWGYVNKAIRFRSKILFLLYLGALYRLLLHTRLEGFVHCLGSRIIQVLIVFSSCLFFFFFSIIFILFLSFVQMKLGSYTFQGILLQQSSISLSFSAFFFFFQIQIRVKLISLPRPLPENEFSDAIKDNYYTANKFSFYLSREQVCLIQILVRHY